MRRIVRAWKAWRERCHYPKYVIGVDPTFPGTWVMTRIDKPGGPITIVRASSASQLVAHLTVEEL